MPAERLPGAQPSPLALQRALRRLHDPLPCAQGAEPGCGGQEPRGPAAPGEGAPGAEARGGRSREEGPTRGGGHAETGLHADRARGTEGSESPGRKAALDTVRGAQVEARAPPAAGMAGVCPAARGARTGQRRGRGPGDGAGESGRRAAQRRREAPAGAGAGAEDAAGLQDKARGGAAARSGPRCPPERSGRDASTSLGHGGCGSPARARPSPGAAARPGAKQRRGQDRGVRPTAARTHPSAIPPPAPGLRSELHRPAAPRPPGAPASHHTARSGASDAASGPATAAATPPLGWGPGRSKRGAQRRLHQPEASHQAASPGLASASANGETEEARRAGAEGRGIAEEVALTIGPPPLIPDEALARVPLEWRGGDTLGRVYHKGPIHHLC